MRPEFHRLLIALLLGAMFIGCDDNSGPPPAALGLVSATDLGVLEQNPRIGYRYGGYSGIINGRSVWLYDPVALTEPDAQGRTRLENSWSWTDDLDPSDGITGFNERLDSTEAPTELIPLTTYEENYNTLNYNEECAATPEGCHRYSVSLGPLVDDPERGRALIFYSAVKTGGFHNSALAVWDDPDAAPMRSEKDLMFGNPAAAMVADGYLYTYDCRYEDFGTPCKDFYTACTVARAPLADALDPEAWRFWDGESWHAEQDRAKAVLDGNFRMTVAWCPFAGVYMAIYNRPFCPSTMLRTAPAPEGPWSQEVKLFDAEVLENDDWVYDALAHPEYAQNDGLTQYVTYSRSTGTDRSEHRVVKVELADVRSE